LGVVARSVERQEKYSNAFATDPVYVVLQELAGHLPQPMNAGLPLCVIKVIIILFARELYSRFLKQPSMPDDRVAWLKKLQRLRCPLHR